MKSKKVPCLYNLVPKNSNKGYDAPHTRRTLSLSSSPCKDLPILNQAIREFAPLYGYLWNILIEMRHDKMNLAPLVIAVRAKMATTFGGSCLTEMT